MSQLVKARKAAQRETLTIGKLKNAVTQIKQAQAKGNLEEKLRQQLMQRQTFVSYGNIYGEDK